MTKKVLITGITGMVGSHLADYLLSITDWDIYGFCRWRSNLENIAHLIDRINQKDRIYLLYGDISDYPSTQTAIKISQPEYVFHLAAQSYPTVSFLSAINTYTTNIQGTANVLEAIHREGLKPWIHVCASSEVYGRVPRERLPIDEECSFHPASPYAISKVGTDLIGRYYADAYSLPVMTTRMFTHTGPRRGDVFSESSFAKQIALIEAGLIPPVIRTGNLNSTRTYLDVRDAVKAYHMLLTVNPISGAYYNIGGTHTCTVAEMLEKMIAISSLDNVNVETDPERLRPIDADMQIPDSQKFIASTGWQSEIPFEQTLSDLLDYWRQKIKKHGVLLDR